MKTKSRVEARTLKGFKDILPAEALVKTDMLAAIRRVFSSFGYVPIETPHLEYTDAKIPPQKYAALVGKHVQDIGADPEKSLSDPCG